MKKWDYRTISIKRLTDIEDLNEEGKNGWELVNILPSYNNCGYRAIFKRECITESTSKTMLID